MFLPDILSTISGMIIPPAWDFIKKKFLPPQSNNIEQTFSTLATTTPEKLPEIIKTWGVLKDAETKHFNRDVVGTPSQWIVDIRAAIRPACTILSLVAYLLVIISYVNSTDTSFVHTLMQPLEIFIGSWWGTRIKLSN